MLLSFAQFEREVTAVRIRDKIAAWKRKGLWMGGNVPLGYQPNGRTLKIDPEESATVKALYNLYLQHRLIRVVKEYADRMVLRSRRRVRGEGRVSGGVRFDRRHIHHILPASERARRTPRKQASKRLTDPAYFESEVDVAVLFAEKENKRYEPGRNAVSEPER